MTPAARAPRRPGAARITLPAPSAQWAYFLDFDGTLVELAPTPASVQVDEVMRMMVDQLTTNTGGAVALISGRSILDLDQMFGHRHLHIAGQHGLERRSSAGDVRAPSPGAPALAMAREFVTARLAAYPSLVLEDKGDSLALHYRAAPRLAAFAHRLLGGAASLAGRRFRLQRGKRVIELVPDAAGKDRAILAFMAEAPFHGRLPVFIGDDLTDEAGFAAVNALGGISVKVGRGRTIARWTMADVDAVRTWLLAVRSPRSEPSPSMTTRSRAHT